MTGRDWRQMRRADFDPSAPLALVEEALVRSGVRVPAVPDRYGTAALFGDEPSTRRAVPHRRGKAEPPQRDALF
ncbi:hypothetical protein ACQEVS_10220 [Streptomyces sp. CA-181903]|uniref:hypothetical protein n=1 Tax=Streptomyces sp. CA-181903 TaxID=3240055 RepID=UPI003D9378A4